MKPHLLAHGLICCLIFFSCQTKTDPIYCITDYGAKGDSITLCTRAIQKAIDAAWLAGGGQVIVPSGIYLTGTIELKSNVVFHLVSGSRIKGSPDINDYKEFSWGHNRDRQPWHLVTARNATNVTIEGQGIIDGNGPAFWKEYNADSFPQWIKAKEQKISPMLEIQECQDIRIKDVTLKTGGGWTLNLYNSDRVQVSGIKILNNVYAPNGDGIDISGCTDVTISDCIIKTCDDAICLKTMVDSRECKRVTVTNCVIECLCAALKIGNESFRNISQVTFSNCIIYGSSRAFAIYAESAGTISDIMVNNIISDTRVPLIYNRPIHICLNLPKPGSGDRNGDWLFKDGKQAPYNGREPAIKNILITNFNCTTEGRILITAEEGRKIENLTMQNIILNYAWIEDPLPFVHRMKSSQFAPVSYEAKTAKAALVLENIHNLTLRNLTINWPESDTVPNEWKFPKRIGNGTMEAFFPDYTRSKQTEFSAIYGRGLTDYQFDLSGMESSNRQVPVFDLKNCSVRPKL